MGREQIRIGDTPEYTKRESMSIGKYLDEIGTKEAYQPLPPNEEAAIAKQARAGDTKAQERLVKANLRFVISVAKKYEGNNLTLDDLVQAGNEGLLEAINRYDESKGFKFISYAVWWIRQSIIHTITTESRVVRIPNNVYQDGVTLTEAEHTFRQTHEREPTYEELQEAVGWRDKRFENANTARFSPVSIDTTHSTQPQARSFAEDLKDRDTPTPEQAVINDENEIRTTIEAALAQLTDTEETVIRALFGIGHEAPHSMHRVASELELSEHHTDHIKRQALEKLKNIVDLETFQKTLSQLDDDAQR